MRFIEVSEESFEAIVEKLIKTGRIPLLDENGIVPVEEIDSNCQRKNK